MKVLSYNVRSLRDDVAALTGIVRACDPDVACLQEVPRFLFWRRKLHRLASDCGLRVVTGGRPAAEVAVLVRPRLTVVEAGSVKLPWHPPRHRRGLAWAVVEEAGTEVAIGSVHLSLDKAERLDQARRVLQLLEATGRPMVVAGDVNEEPGGPAWQLLAERLTDAGSGPTIPARAPSRRIDGVFADPRIHVVRCGVPELPRLADASDHLPVLAELSVG